MEYDFPFTVTEIGTFSISDPDAFLRPRTRLGLEAVSGIKMSHLDPFAASPAQSRVNGAFYKRGD